MVAVIESDHPNEGYLRVAATHQVLAALYGLGAIGLLRIVYRAIRTPGPDDSVFGASLSLAIVIVVAVVHLFAAKGTRKQQAWARVFSRVIGFLLFPVFPIGTAVGMYIFANTRPDRWAAGRDASKAKERTP